MFYEFPGMARGQLLPHNSIVTKAAKGCFPVIEGYCSADGLAVSELVNPVRVHYNRNGWVRTHGWNAGCVRCICH